MSQDTTNSFFIGKVVDSLTSAGNLQDQITELALKGKDAVINIDSTSGVTENVPAQLFRQGVATALHINNSAGAAAIDLEASDSVSSGVLGAALQDALHLTQVGSMVAVKLFRTGAGTSAIKINTSGLNVTSMTGTAAVAYVRNSQRSSDGATGACVVVIVNQF